MLKKIKSDESGNLSLVQAAIYLIVLLTILYIGLTINQNVIDASSIAASVDATGTYSSTTNVSFAEYSGGANVNISTETYTLTDGTGGAFNVDLSGGANNSSGFIAALVAEINTNSTLVTAVDNGDNTTTVTSVISGTVGNAYISTDNVTGSAWGSATLTGGVASDELYTASTDMDTTTASAYGMAGIMPIVLIAVAILGSLLGLVYLFR